MRRAASILCLASVGFYPNTSAAQNFEDIDKLANNTKVIQAECDRSVVTLKDRLPMRCVESPMYVLWPNGRVSIIFIAVDPDGVTTNISFNANSDDQPTLRHYITKLSDVRIGPLSKPDSWKQIRVSGKCEMYFRDDQAKQLVRLTCLAKASGSGSPAVFDFSTGPGSVP